MVLIEVVQFGTNKNRNPEGVEHELPQAPVYSIKSKITGPPQEFNVNNVIFLLIAALDLGVMTDSIYITETV